MEVGFATKVREFLIHVNGLPTVRINDLVETEAGSRGWVAALLPDQVEVLMLDEVDIGPGQIFKRTKSKLTINVGSFLLGRAINPLGVPIDGKPPLPKKGQAEAEIEKEAVGFGQREFISSQFDTGVTLVDTIIPLGRGQRELVLGDARSGKTSFLVDVITNQIHTGAICVYASIGKPITEVKSIMALLAGNKALSHTVVIASVASDKAPLIFLTAQTAFSVAEYFQKQGKHVLVVLDDMGTHAKIYREIALLAGRSPGRESYPGDIFHQQARILERAGNFKNGGSITALPVIELNLSDFTTFIPTNLMAATDGYLIFKSSLYNQGQRPAIDISLSVSRVGQQTQTHVQNLMSTRIKQVLGEATRLEAVSRLAFELPAQTQTVLKQKELIEELIRQDSHSYIPKNVQLLLLALPFTSFAKDNDREALRKQKRQLVDGFLAHPALGELSQKALSLTSDKQMIEEVEKVLPTVKDLLAQPKGYTKYYKKGPIQR